MIFCGGIHGGAKTFVLCLLFFYTTTIGAINGHCENLPNVTHATSNATIHGIYPEGTVISFECNEKYSSLDNPFYTCKDGNFTGHFSCMKCACALPNASAEHNLLYNKNCYISYGCKAGYSCHGQASLFCTPERRWIPNKPPECKPVSCGDFGPIENGKIECDSAKERKTSFGSIGRIECNDGFLLDGEKYTTCQADGTWSPKGTCKPFNCPIFSGIKSKCVEKTQIHWNSYYVKCRDDIPSTDIGEITSPMKCQENNVWLNRSRYCFCPCDVSNLLKDKNIVTNGLEHDHFLMHDSYLHWTCANGTLAKENNSENVYCSDGELSFHPSCEKIIPIIHYETQNDSDDQESNIDEKGPIDVGQKQDEGSVLIAVAVSGVVAVGLIITFVLLRRRRLQYIVQDAEDTLPQEETNTLLNETENGKSSSSDSGVGFGSDTTDASQSASHSSSNSSPSVSVELNTDARNESTPKRQSNNNLPRTAAGTSLFASGGAIIRNHETEHENVPYETGYLDTSRNNKPENVYQTNISKKNHRVNALDAIAYGGSGDPTRPTSAGNVSNEKDANTNLEDETEVNISADSLPDTPV